MFAPLNKHSLRLGGLTEEDELRHIQKSLQVPGFVCEFNITGQLWTSRVTSHVPVREVADLITQEGICDAVQIIDRSEEHTSELQSLMRSSYAVFCLKKKIKTQ